MKLIALLFLLFLFALYSVGVSPSVYGGDSGDIILASWFGGVAHPPGYPLQTMIGWVFTHLPYQATVAYKANLLAAFLMAITIVLFFFILNKLTKNLYVSLSSTLTLAFTPLFWVYAHIIEVFQLNLVLVGASVYFLFAWREKWLAAVGKKGKDKATNLLRWSLLFLGLAVFHHHTSILLFPAFGYLILKTNKAFLGKKNLLKSSLFFLCGLLPYIFIPFAAFRQTPINWDNPVNIVNFIRLITRADYGTFIAASFLVGSSLHEKLLQLLNYILFLKADFTIIGAFFILVGMIYGFFWNRTVFWFTLLAIIFTGPFFLFYASFPLANSFYVGLWERFLLLSYFFIAVFLGLGIKAFYEYSTFFMRRKIKLRFFRSESMILFASFALLLLPFYFFLWNYGRSNLSDFKLGNWLGQDILSSAESNAIIFVLGDTTAFNSEYIYYTSEAYSNVKFIKGGPLRLPGYRNQVAAAYKDLNFPVDFLSNEIKDPGMYISSIMSENYDKYPIYAMNYYPNFENRRWISVGLLRKLVPEGIAGENILKLNNEVYSKFSYNDFSTPTGYEHYMSNHIKEIYYESTMNLVDELMTNDLKKEAINYARKAAALSLDKKDVYVKLGLLYMLQDDCKNSEEPFLKAHSLDNKDIFVLEQLINVARDCKGNADEATFYQKLIENVKLKAQPTFN
ncbi:hypothetical protein A3A49_02900 [Candidatus Curtissbacteria bacterium RIFCSPLOWO2_01_FULL_38_11b]|uniref:DUF2723 domain-containing protein n=1 Tax=Candidatus Curtissbacteria bacterium RIFCSPLOWO2_01_FULL_38_11b TaxID=1797725 RepID=A0A1F5H0J8_9BACT|nr:MAG: hypothetical protein A3A49_02900 [Candidatus Curtissbacteria bacterium RIFCSPLOWO2_01_FULL_38_11b]